MPEFTAYLCDRTGLIADQHILTGKFKVATNCQRAAEDRVKALLKRSSILGGGAGSLFVRVVETHPYIDFSGPDLPDGCRHVRQILNDLELDRAGDFNREHLR